MRLIIKPASEIGNRVFTSADVVTGLVYLEIDKSLAISEIKFSIKARLHSTENTTAGVESPPIPCFYPLFESSQVLFPRPPLDNSVRYTLGKGRHEYGFGVDFSLLSRYAQAELSHHPYFRVCQQHWDRSRIYYSISVTVKGCGLFRRPVRKSIYLVSATLESPGIPRLPPSKGLSRQSFQILHFDSFAMRSDPRAKDDKVPPPYTPAIVLRAGISSDGGVLYAGDVLPLSLWVTVPLVAQGQLKAALKSARLFMVDPAIVSDHGHRIIRPAGTFIREVQLDINLQARSKNETFQVESASWNCCKVPQSLSMTQSIHEVVQPKLLQILCEFSCDGMASSIFTSVLVAVDIATANAPPKYVALDSQRTNYMSEEGLPEYEMGRNIVSG